MRALPSGHSGVISGSSFCGTTHQLRFGINLFCFSAFSSNLRITFVYPLCGADSGSNQCFAIECGFFVFSANTVPFRFRSSRLIAAVRPVLRIQCQNRAFSPLPRQQLFHAVEGFHCDYSGSGVAGFNGYHKQTLLRQRFSCFVVRTGPYLP